MMTKIFGIDKFILKKIININMITQQKYFCARFCHFKHKKLIQFRIHDIYQNKKIIEKSNLKKIKR